MNKQAPVSYFLEAVHLDARLVFCGVDSWSAINADQLRPYAVPVRWEQIPTLNFSFGCRFDGGSMAYWHWAQALHHLVNHGRVHVDGSSQIRL